MCEACESIKDLNVLHAGLGIADEVPGDVVRNVCEGDLSVLSILNQESQTISRMALTSIVPRVPIMEIGRKINGRARDTIIT